MPNGMSSSSITRHAVGNNKCSDCLSTNAEHHARPGPPVKGWRNSGQAVPAAFSNVEYLKRSAERRGRTRRPCIASDNNNISSSTRATRKRNFTGPSHEYLMRFGGHDVHLSPPACTKRKFQHGPTGTNCLQFHGVGALGNNDQAWIRNDFEVVLVPDALALNSAPSFYFPLPFSLGDEPWMASQKQLLSVQVYRNGRIIVSS